MRFIRTKWNALSAQVDTEGQIELRKEIALFIEQQIATKEKLFLQKMWTNDFSRLIGDELLAQALAYRGPLFDSYQEEVLSIPVNFSYGIFAISYLRYRSDVNAGRLKALGFNTMLPPVKLSCEDHGGSGLVRFQQWTGTEWRATTDWMSGDRQMVRKMVEESAARYAAEKNIKPGCLPG